MRTLLHTRCGRRWSQLCFLTVMGFAWFASSTTTWASHCAGITDPYAKAKCTREDIRATGALNPARVNSQQSAVPQYNGSSGCTSAGCAGASQSGYFNTTGDVSALNADGTNALVTDPNATKVQDMQTQTGGWNLSTSAPVVSANQVSSTWVFNPQTNETCSVSTICIEYAPGPPATQTCTMPGVTRLVCNQDYSPSLTAQACGTPPNGTPPVHTETFINGCAPWSGLIASGQAIPVSQACVDTSARILACPNYNGVTILIPTSQAFAQVQGSGTWTGYYSINYGIPTPNGLGGYTMSFSVSGNAVGENKFGCTNGQSGGGTWIMREGDTISYGGSPPFCNRRCSCFGVGLSFTMGYATWATPTSFSIPFTYVLNGMASGTINILGGLTRSSYTVSPDTGCWTTRFEYDITTQIPDSCQPYRDAGCSQTGSLCTTVDPISGTCQIYTNTYDCPGGQVCTKTQDVKSCNSCGTPGSYVPFCTDTSTRPNTNFQQAATMMALIKDVQNGFDKDNLRIFTGTPKRCDYSTFGTVFIDCCADDPSRMLGSCSDEEVSLAADKKAKEVIYVGTRCVEWWGLLVGKVCARKEDVFCTFKSMLGRMVQEQGKPQLGQNFGTPDLPDCDGFTINEFASLNFQAMNWTEFFANVTSNYDQSAVAARMRTQACSFSGTSC